MRYTLELEPHEVLLVGKALETLPYVQVYLLIGKVQAQITKQDEDFKAAPVERLRREG